MVREERGEDADEMGPASARKRARPTWRCARALLALAAAAAALVAPSGALLAPTPTSPRPATRRGMIGGVFGGGQDNKEDLPKDIRDAISKCRGAVQAALQDKISYMVRRAGPCVRAAGSRSCRECPAHLLLWPSIS